MQWQEGQKTEKPISICVAINDTWPVSYSNGMRAWNIATRRDYFNYERNSRGHILTAYASFIVELTDKATEDKKHNPYLFEMLYQTLHYMCEGVDPEVLSLIYQTKMLPVLGMRPYFDTCAICHQETDFVAFSVREGGFLCSRHAEQDPYRIPVGEAVHKLLRLFFHFDLHRLGNVSVKDSTKTNAFSIEYIL